MDKIQMAKEIRAAIKQGDVEKVTELIGNDMIRLNMSTPFGTWLHVASSSGNIDVVKRLVTLGMDVNKCDGTFNSEPINEAASGGYANIVEYLLSCGARLNVSEPEKNPLFGAIYGGHLNVVKLLHERGIDIHVKYTGASMKNMDALAFAQERGQKEIELFLTETRILEKG